MQKFWYLNVIYLEDIGSAPRRLKEPPLCYCQFYFIELPSERGITYFLEISLK